MVHNVLTPTLITGPSVVTVKPTDVVSFWQLRLYLHGTPSRLTTIATKPYFVTCPLGPLQPPGRPSPSSWLLKPSSSIIITSMTITVVIITVMIITIVIVTIMIITMTTTTYLKPSSSITVTTRAANELRISEIAPNSE